jgi:hypothetical protein
VTYGEQLLWWIGERYRILKSKEAGDAPPWSSDLTFQTVYFCNVRREDDKVTRFVRSFYAPFSQHPNLIYNYVFARMINWPETIQRVGFLTTHNPDWLEAMLEEARLEQSKVWGGAYLITTHGVPMAKAAYLADHVLEAVDKGLGRPSAGGPHPALPPTLSGLHGLLMQFEGLGSFLAAQIVADLKNTEGHPAKDAPDWWTFVAHGPGSLRGASWVHYGEIGKITPSSFASHFQEIRDYVDARWPESVPRICNQDLQNCLCEFDKYMRVSTGAGRSKRNYDGQHPR